MQTCQAYQSCPVCTHSWSKPLHHGVVCDGHRAFLPEGDPGRQRTYIFKGQKYEYKDECTTAPPKTKDNEFVKSILTLCTSRKPILGHKTPPLPARMPGFDWLRVLGCPEIMHGKCLFKSIYCKIMFTFISV